jgi:predicted nuclease of predicted toxin-antitoxin system
MKKSYQAIEQERMIITLDLDFGEIFHFYQRKRTGVIILRVQPTIENVNAVLERFLSSVDIENHEKSLIIVDWHKYRIRK